MGPQTARSQGRVGADSTTRWKAFRRDVAYGTAMSALFAEKDQLAKDPPQWGTGLSGYSRRFASNAGEFVIQESVTDALAAAMRRQPDYVRCGCRGVGARASWALEGSITDPTLRRGRVLAVPRIVGAYAGSFAQASWRPATPTNRAQVALINGTTSLLIGAGINLYHELISTWP